MKALPKAADKNQDSSNELHEDPIQKIDNLLAKYHDQRKGYLHSMKVIDDQFKEYSSKGVDSDILNNIKLRFENYKKAVIEIDKSIKYLQQAKVLRMNISNQNNESS